MPSEPLNLIHLANFNSTNIGNGALISGLESTIEEDFPQPVKWQREAWDDYTFQLLDFDKNFVDKVNNSDGLIVGGAVTFNGRDYNNRTGTRFELPLDLWPALKKPVVFYGLSYRHWPGQTYHHADKLKATIEKILASKQMLLTLRNDGTREWLKELTGIDSKEILEIPDSAVFVRAADGSYPEMVEGARNIIVSFNDEDAGYRYNGSSRDQAVQALASTVEKLAERYKLNVILCPHYFDDFKMMSDFIACVNPRLAHQKMITTGLCRVPHTGLFYGRYKKADLAISMRVHSMSPCIGLGTPMVAFTTQARMTDFMIRAGLQEQSLDALGDGAADKLYEKAVRALDHPAEVRKKFSVAAAALRSQTKNFHSRLHKFLIG